MSSFIEAVPLAMVSMVLRERPPAVRVAAGALACQRVEKVVSPKG